MYRLIIVATHGDFAKIVGFRWAVKQICWMSRTL